MKGGKSLFNVVRAIAAAKSGRCVRFPLTDAQEATRTWNVHRIREAAEAMETDIKVGPFDGSQQVISAGAGQIILYAPPEA